MNKLQQELDDTADAYDFREYMDMTIQPMPKDEFFIDSEGKRHRNIRICIKHEIQYPINGVCPRCRDESLPKDYKRGRNKLFKS